MVVFYKLLCVYQKLALCAVGEKESGCTLAGKLFFTTLAGAKMVLTTLASDYLFILRHFETFGK
jgi:hypothetical protein